jgi:hypothetical protein
MFSDLRTWRSAAVLMVIWTGGMGGGATGRAAESAANLGREVALPTDVAPYWAWLPADTETAIVARDVAFTTPWDAPPSEIEQLTGDERRRMQQETSSAMSKDVALGALHYLGGGNMLEGGPYKKLLAPVRARLVVYGGRGYEPVSVFGGMRFHGASVIEFAEPDVAAVDAWLATLEKDARNVRTMNGRKTLVFPYDKDLMEPSYQVLPWQGTYVTRIAENVIVCASSDVYLMEVFERIESPPADRALPATLPEWKYVDMTAGVWGLRHIPAVEGQKLAGVTWLAEPGERRTFEAYYWWVGEPDLDTLATSWFGKAKTKGATSAEQQRDHIEELADGVTKVTIPLEEIGRTIRFPMFSFYILQASLGRW